MDIRLNILNDMYQNLQIIKLSREVLGISADDILMENILKEIPVEDIDDDEFKNILNEYFRSINIFYNLCKYFNPLSNITIIFPSNLNKEGMECFEKYLEYAVFFICSLIEYEKNIKYEHGSTENIKMIKTIYSIIIVYQKYPDKEQFIKECERLEFNEEYIKICINIFFNESTIFDIYSFKSRKK